MEVVIILPLPPYIYIATACHEVNIGSTTAPDRRGMDMIIDYTAVYHPHAEDNNLQLSSCTEPFTYALSFENIILYIDIPYSCPSQR